MEDKIIPSGEMMDEKLKSIRKIKVDLIDWVTYYIDEKNGEKWIKEFLYPEMHAGGPAQLRLIQKFPWE